MTIHDSALLETLGITKAEMIDRVVAKCANQIMSSSEDDEDGCEYVTSSEVEKRLVALCKERIDAKVQEIADLHVFPRINQFIEELTLQETNRWGEKRGEPLSFNEYLVARANDYLTETVNYNGESKSEARDSYSWRGSQTRITNLIHKHLQYSIETAMKDAVKIVNDALAKGLQETVRLKIAEITNSLKVITK